MSTNLKIRACSKMSLQDAFNGISRSHMELSSHTIRGRRETVYRRPRNTHRFILHLPHHAFTVLRTECTHSSPPYTQPGFLVNSPCLNRCSSNPRNANPSSPSDSCNSRQSCRSPASCSHEWHVRDLWYTGYKVSAVVQHPNGKG